MKRDILTVILIMFGTLVILDSTFLHNRLKHINFIYLDCRGHFIVIFYLHIYIEDFSENLNVM